MGKPTGFLEAGREVPERRPVPVRLRDWKEVYQPFPTERLQVQASRCMDCGIPFCNDGCPLGNLIPDWNDLVYRDQWRGAIERLHATNNFPEFTGRLCPAPCEAACVLGINSDPVTIKQVEVSIIDRAWDEGWVEPVTPEKQTGKRVAVVGSGPAGLAAAQQLTRAGHSVTVYERDDQPGGLLRYGIPEFKMEKRHLDRRIEQMEAEGTAFVCGVTISATTGPGTLSASDLRAAHDAVVIAVGATVSRDLPIPGRDLAGVHHAMEYLPLANRAVDASDPATATPITAAGKRVVIIGGGDTGADCLGTAHRQGALSVHQFEIMPRPPDSRDSSTPWPTWPLMFRTSSAHEEGGERLFAVNTIEFTADVDGRVSGLRACEVDMSTVDGRPRFDPVEGTEFDLPCELVLLALGFSGPEPDLASAFGVSLTPRGTIARSDAYETDVPGVFVCGDAGRGQSLIVWAIAEGRSAAASADRWLEGETLLPAPLPQA
ncbi:MAG TPA: glutamate synthase subunit beta [Acidimicrobiales bacterium]|nr:glutamate synthase subunit beta [Acidimicrobiales bacterium]